MLSEKAKAKLMELSEVDNCDFEYNRKSKWVIEISLVKKLCIFSKFKFNVRKGTMERML